ncbi:MAG: hypothetical protein KGJ68_11380 [Gammaproteobacteria bacterium]|nr:hypothetical protein [Gammaproteobacteria bacterium]
MDSAAFAAVLMAAFAGFFASIVWMAVVHRRFVQRLRTQHPDGWNGLWSPPESLSRYPQAAWKARARVTFYLYAREFRGLEDPVTRCLGERAWRAHMIFFGYTVVAVALLVALVGFAR